MRILFALAFVLAATASADAARFSTFDGNMTFSRAEALRKSRNPIVVRNNNGGSMAAASRLVGSRVVIDGSCYSACAWSFVRNPKACYTQNASFGFHGAHDPTFGTPIPKATALLLGQTKSSLRHRIGGVAHSSGAVWVSAAEMRRLYPERACR